MSLYKGTQLIAGGRQTMPLLSFMWADHQLNDISWLRADTFSWQSGAVYTAVYQHLVDDCEVAYAYINSESSVCWLRTSTPQVGDSVYNNWQYTTDPVATIVAYDESTQTITLSGVWPYGEPRTFTRYPYSDKLGKMSSETIAGITISFYRAPDGHKITTDENAVLSIYNATGVAWYYVLDTVNTRFKLPRTKYGATGLRDTVGSYVEAGLPNITGSVDLTGQGNTTTPRFNANDVADSALYNNVSITAGRYHTDSSSGGGYNRIEIDASRSNSIYGNSDTVQPKATQMYLYFYVGQFTQTALENTAGLNTEMFNDLNAHKVIEYQEPTADNGYTWYRKYADGWCEQGGLTTVSTTANNAVYTISITLPVEMADNNYTGFCSVQFGGGSAWNGTYIDSSSTTTVAKFCGWVSGSSTITAHAWTVSGTAA